MPTKKPTPKIAFVKKPTKADLLAASLLAIQIEILGQSPTLRQSMKVTLTQLKGADNVRKALQGVKSAKK
jgi:hypothetical protein